jgi:hypothetical protein
MLKVLYRVYHVFCPSFNAYVYITILVVTLELKDASKHYLHWKIYTHTFRIVLYVFINILMTVIYGSIPVAMFKELHNLPLFILLCFQRRSPCFWLRKQWN